MRCSLLPLLDFLRQPLAFPHSPTKGGHRYPTSPCCPYYVMSLFFSPATEGTGPSSDEATTMGVPVVKKPSTPAQGGAGWEIKEKSPGAPANSSMRRLACDACRDRKVRCGREDPTCSRCVKVGNNCHYSSRSKPASTKMNLPRFLMTLNNRLSKSTSLLAFTAPRSIPVV